MRTTINLDAHVFKEAVRLTGIHEKTSLLHQGLRALILIEKNKRLAALGGSEPHLKEVPRRRIQKKI